MKPQPPVWQDKKKDNSQQSLLSDTPEWQEHWQGMPEFVQNEQEAYATINVRFRNAEDLAAFAKLIEQPFIQRRTTHIWFPQMQYGVTAHLHYVDES